MKHRSDFPLARLAAPILEAGGGKARAVLSVSQARKPLSWTKSPFHRQSVDWSSGLSHPTEARL
ncbi:hypothetical protein NEUTE2DRAFT_121897, partial [Neurospora tetrasperma FGSC 2509]